VPGRGLLKEADMIVGEKVLFSFLSGDRQAVRAGKKEDIAVAGLY